MPSFFEDGVAKGVVTKDMLAFGGTGDSMVTIDIRVLATGRTRVRQVIDRETKTILKRDSKALRKERKPKDVRWD